ncbi:hypothetical protein [Aliarcobacter butzleri]|uniref:Uncharacterized protein n=1 Tax=Aliarcobacter butzleri TaxID=28197 RepID=A0AAW7Q110_9BACT|nr:hypothetical protein [Aliarcobacter butzleri]MCG3684346.1 hypothetical protein [Aliarcobacter butzleri]MDN5071568.1 hypothetical protein [Aliarcobacter butzleri]MDN5095485.1 hypothetical protein [Aliarcobacter butzleri]PZQ04987.1 MAG: hypothetical protein DI567_10015 [Aliarcobacter butzleri]
MIIIKPEIALRAYKENDFSIEVTKNIRKQALENINKEIPKESLFECIEYIKEFFKIDFTENEFIEILKLYPYQRCSLIQWGFSDTVVRESMGDIIANFFAGSRAITYGDESGNDFTKEYYSMLKTLAKNFGYKTIEREYYEKYINDNGKKIGDIESIEGIKLAYKKQLMEKK